MLRIRLRDTSRSINDWQRDQFDFLVTHDRNSNKFPFNPTTFCQARSCPRKKLTKSWSCLRANKSWSCLVQIWWILFQHYSAPYPSWIYHKNWRYLLRVWAFKSPGRNSISEKHAQARVLYHSLSLWLSIVDVKIQSSSKVH